MRLTLITLSLLRVYGSIMKLHVGVVTQDNVPPGHYQYDTMIKALAMFKDWLAKKNNVIGNTTMEITWHMADGQQNKKELRKIGPALANGTWKDTYYTGSLVTHAYSGTEPPMAPCDIIMIEAWSDIFPSFLEGLQEAGIRLPVYAAGASGKGVYVNDDGSEKWNFVVHGLELADKSFASILQELYLHEARSVVLLEEANGGAWVTSVAGYVRTFSKDYIGMQVLVDEQISFIDCELLGSEQATVCRENVYEMLAKYLEPLKSGKRVRSYHADIFAFVGKRWMCDDLMYAIHRLTINFKAIVLPNWCMSAKKPALKDSPRWVKDFDYVWTPSGFSSRMLGYHFDEAFSSAAMFEKHGFTSPAEFVDQWIKKWGSDPGGYDHAWTLASFYYLWRDIVLSNGDKANIIKQFDDYRAPITSYMGLLGSKTGGWNPFHKWVGLQTFPKEDAGKLKGSRVVAPAEYAERMGKFPMPFWQDRRCLPNECEKCPKCEELLRNQWIIYLSVELVLVAVAIGLGILHKYRKFNLMSSLSALAFIALLLFKTMTTFIAMNVMILRHSVGDLENISNAVFQAIFISFGMISTFATVYVTVVIGVYRYQQDMRELEYWNENPNTLRKFPRLRQLIVWEYIAELRKVASCIPDAGIMITQFIAVIWLEEVNSAIILALLMNAYGFGAALKSLAISDLIGECGEYEGLPMVKGLTWKIKALAAFNPFYTAFAFMKAVLIQWTRVEYDTVSKGEAMAEDESTSKALIQEIEEINSLNSISEMEARLAELGSKVRRMSTRTILIPTDKQKSL